MGPWPPGQPCLFCKEERRSVPGGGQAITPLLCPCTSFHRRNLACPSVFLGRGAQPGATWPYRRTMRIARERTFIRRPAVAEVPLVLVGISDTPMTDKAPSPL